MPEEPKDKPAPQVEVDEEENAVQASVNPDIYPLPIIYQACDVFLDRAYVFMDGDPEEEVEVMLKPKEDADLEELAGEFSNELVNYSSYFVRRQVNKDTREAMLKRAFLTASGASESEEEVEEKFEEMEAKKQKIDLGTKVPIVGEGSESQESGSKEPGESSREEAQGKKETASENNREVEEEEDSDEIRDSDVFKKWEEQPGKIDEEE